METSQIQARILMGPGPSDVSPRVLETLARPTIGHLDGQFLELLNDIREMLQAVFQTKNALTLAVSGTGSAGMETCVVNLIEPGDAMLVCVNGVFGGRMADVAGRAGAKVTTIEVPWGQVFSPEQVQACLSDKAVERAVLNERVQAEKAFAINATPSFVINGKKYSGGMPLDQFRKAIDPLLAATAKPAK